ncbi:MAG: peptidase U32 [Desulfuromonadales bacterium C00003068]|jgi:putative protease|nr:MAG: peptidase U32 [Desulfuromonadales bacterium C00003068]
MTKKFELLAPGGDIESIKAAIVAGADAVYCGLNHFNARNRATNIEIGDLNQVLRLAHANQCKVFLTINILIIENEFKSLINLLNKLVNTTLDGVIVQDLGLFHLLATHFTSLEVHASTQLTTHNAGQVKFLEQLDVERVNLCRELNIDEIKELVDIGHQRGISSEVFVHGSYCIGFSGMCYLSSVLEGKSGNRGRCSQHCRDAYQPTAQGMSYPLNLRDNSAFNDLHQLAQAGVDSLKIEGRMKKFHYVYTVVDSWRKLLNQFYATGQSRSDDTAIYRVFNRTFSNGFLTGELNKNMFIDNPRDSSALHFSEKNSTGNADDGLKGAKRDLYDARTVIMEDVRAEIETLTTEKIPLSVKLSGRNGELLQVEVVAAEKTFRLCSKGRLALVDIVSTEPPQHKPRPNGLDHDSLRQRFETLDEIRFQLQKLDLTELESQLFLPFKEMTVISKKILSRLVGEHKNIAAVMLPRLTAKHEVVTQPKLAVLISSVEQIAVCSDSTATLYFQLPSCFSHDLAHFVDIFRQNSRLIPWFPALLIGEHYTAAIELLAQVQPERIVTNNSGIAYEAYKRGISWLAGPHLNSINSYTLLCLKERFNCAGAFISNELSREQIALIANPDDFDLHYSLFHPVLLLSSRQCLLHQIDGCEKSRIDDDCQQHCTRTATITNEKHDTLIVHNSKGNYPSLYHSHHFLNSDIVTDLPKLFSGFLIDLSVVENETIVSVNQADLIELFETLLAGEGGAKLDLERVVQHTTDAQYHQGI